MKRLILLCFIVLAFPAHAFEPIETIGGTARVVDGDTIRVDRVPVRLNGISAPEATGGRIELGGIEATDALRELAQDRHVVCQLDGSKTYGREVGRCRVDGVDVGEAMVRAGLALDCPRYSGGDYAAAERHAVANGLDLAATYALPSYCKPL